MDWNISFKASALKELKQIDRKQQTRILLFMDSLKDNPRKTGKALKGHLVGLWRYRVGDYRLICQIQDDCLLVLTLKIGHRRDIYD